jgi:radical SAM superfamily enzyme YgiQ (UPF0313 family)
VKILLISANTVTSPYPVYPLGLDYVAAALPSRHKVEIADMNTISRHGLVQLLDNFKPEAVGISLRNIDNTDTTNPQGFMAAYRELTRTVRRHSDAPIILGGAGFSIFPERILFELAADFGIVGEGEHLAALLDALESNQPAKPLPGVVIPGQVHISAPAATQVLSSLFNPNHRHRDFYLRHGGMLNIQTKRGCPFRCIYCTYPHIEGGRFRLMDPVLVGRQAKAAQEAGARYLFITDSAFNADIRHSLAVADQLRQNGVSVPWGAFLAPLKMPEGYLDTLVRAGMTHAEFGTESLCDDVLQTYGKPFDRSDVLQAHGHAVQAGLHVAHYFLFGGPGETDDTLEATLSHIDKLKKSVLFLFCGMRIYPHTALFDRAVQEGLISPKQDLLEPVFYQSAAISRGQIMERVEAKANKRINWVIGSGGNQTGVLLLRMYSKGYSGPLWEYLIR